MVEQRSSGSEPTSAQTLDALDSYFLVPANFSADMPDEVWQAEAEAMFKANQASRAFVDGQITPDEFSQALAECGYDPHQLWDRWDNGLTLNEP